jgi:hypothetical protein
MRAVASQRRFSGRNGARYTEAEKCEAVTVVEASSSLAAARELLTAIWPAKAAPSENTLSRWHRDPCVEPDAELLGRIESERKRFRDERLHRLFDRLTEKLEAEVESLVPGGSWRGVKDGMIAVGIARDKLDPPMRSVPALSVNTGTGPTQIIIPYGPKELEAEPGCQ